MKEAGKTMKKMIGMMLVLALAAGTVCGALAETGYETLYALFADGETFGEPSVIREQEAAEDTDLPAVDDAEAEAAQEGQTVCFAIFLFYPEDDITQAILIGTDEDGQSKMAEWLTDYETGAAVMTFLCGRFEELRAMMAEDVDFCISFSFDAGENMINIDTTEAAQELLGTAEGTGETADGQE